jgi:transaldolase
LNIERINVDEETFERMHKENKMASDKLTEGIKGFSEALGNLEKLLSKRLTELGAGQQQKEPVGAR